MDPLPPHLILGNWGEAIAVRYLQKQGWKLLEKNWRGGGGEIDSIFRKRKTLIFVEVRTRRFSTWPPPYFTIRHRKKQVFRRACRSYLRSLRWRPSVVQVDVIGIQYTNFEEYELHHAENVGWLGPWFSW